MVNCGFLLKHLVSWWRPMNVICHSVNGDETMVLPRGSGTPQTYRL